ncbi:MAG: hypothetical protein ACPGO3_01490 [Magnetospiraceae bacterium]
MRWTSPIVAALALLVTTACSDPNIDEIKQLSAELNKDIVAVGDKLDQDVLPYDKKLTEYATKAKELLPDRAKDIDWLAAAGTKTRNPILKDLQARSNRILRNVNQNRVDSAQAVTWMRLLTEAATEKNVDAGLVDEINTIAAMTKGALKPLDVPEDKVGLPGDRLVGNSHYGQWTRTSSGSTYWYWHPIYAPIMGPGRWSYSGWYYDRPWSYRYDRYQNRYGSATWRQSEVGRMSSSWGSIKQYGKQTGRTPSSFATRTNTSVPPPPPPRAGRTASGVPPFSRTSTQAATSGPRTVSTYGSSYSNSASSSYRASTRSGGSSGGK